MQSALGPMVVACPTPTFDQVRGTIEAGYVDHFLYNLHHSVHVLRLLIVHTLRIHDWIGMSQDIQVDLTD